MPEQRKTTAMTDKEKREALHAAESRLNIDGHFDLASKMLAIAADYALATTEPTGWQPIETAPKDGTYMLLYPSPWSDSNYRSIIGYYDTNEYAKRPRPYWSLCGCDTTTSRINQPTHWMPLPPPPKGGQP